MWRRSRASQFWRLVGQAGGPGDLLGRSEGDLGRASGVGPGQWRPGWSGCSSAGYGHLFELERLEQSGVANADVVRRRLYPERLHGKARIEEAGDPPRPPVLSSCSIKPRGLAFVRKPWQREKEGAEVCRGWGAAGRPSLGLSAHPRGCGAGESTRTWRMNRCDSGPEETVVGDPWRQLAHHRTAAISWRCGGLSTTGGHGDVLPPNAPDSPFLGRQGDGP